MKTVRAKENVFRFKRFSVSNRHSAMKVGTDGVLLGAWALLDTDVSPTKIVDVGTGTGVIALMMAQRFPDAGITGVEIDPEAAAEAAANFCESPWPDRLKCAGMAFESFCKECHGAHSHVDLLISNPPFFPNGPVAPDTCRSLARHEGELSPVALIRSAAEILSPDGRLCLISTDISRDSLEFEAELVGLSMERRTAVSTGEGKPPRRILWQFARKGVASVAAEDRLTIRLRTGEASAEYTRLVEPYYLYVK